MRIGYLSPLPPVRSGVSEYSVELLPHLARLAEVEVFAEDAEGAAPLGDGWHARPAGEFDRDAGLLPLYHLGNNPHHRWIHQRAIARPGVIVLHDLVLHHYHVEETLGRGDRAAYQAGLERVYGEEGRGAAIAHLHEVSSEALLFAFPLFEPVAAASLGVLVHNRRAARLVQERVPGVPVAVAPMGMPDLASEALPERAAARRALDLPDDTFLVGLFGFLTPMKRPQVAMRAFARLRQRLPGARLALVGEASQSLDLAGEARALGLGEAVTLSGYVPFARAREWAAACDVFLNLRYPTAGETSASLLRLLGWGRPVLVSDYAQYREIPEEVALHVPPGPAEEAELAELLELLARRPAIGATLGRNAAAYVAERHRLVHAAAAYAAFLDQVAAGSRRPPGRLRPWFRLRSSHTPCRPAAELAGPDLSGGWAPGERRALPIAACNRGDTTWLGAARAEGGGVVVGAYLRDRRGRRLADLGQVAIGRDLAPGETVEVDLRLTMPEGEIAAGTELVVGVRIGGWGWLHGRGGSALVYPLRLDSSGAEPVG